MKFIVLAIYTYLAISTANFLFKTGIQIWKENTK